MSIQIPVSFVNQYRDNVYRLVQQNGSLLRNLVMEDSVKGETAYYEQMGAVFAKEKAGRHVDTPQQDTPHSRRRLDLSTYNWADLIDNDDQVRLLIDPTSKYVVNAADAMGRQTDAIIVDAMLGTSKAGHEGSESIELGANQTIVHGDSGFTFDKLVEAKIKMDAANVPYNDRFLVITAAQLGNLLKETKVTSSDYATVKALVRGDIDTFMGFKFISCNGKRDEAGNPIIPLVTAGGSNIRSCFAFHRDALQLGIGQNPVARITERDDKCYATQVYFEMSLGAVRMEEARVVKIECKE